MAYAVTNNYTSAAANIAGNEAMGIQETKLANFIPSVWAKRILDKLKEECRLIDNCWKEYEGEIVRGGAVHITGIGNVTISKYEGYVEYSKIDAVGQTLPIDQANYFALEFDDVERAQTVPGLWEGTNQEAVEKLAIERDTYIGQKIAGVTASDKVTVVSDMTKEHAIKRGIDRALVALKKRNMREKMQIELTPEVAMAFLGELTAVSTDNPEYIKKGVIGFYHGHQVVESNCLHQDGTTHYCAIRGKKAIAFVGQLQKVEALRREGAFADAVRGLDVFGAKVIDENRLQVLKVTVPAEA